MEIITDEIEVRYCTIQVRRIALTCQQDIAETVRKLSSAVGEDGFVFTSGGIGPTHDDVTYEGIVRLIKAARSFFHYTCIVGKSF